VREFCSIGTLQRTFFRTKQHGIADAKRVLRCGGVMQLPDRK
jgi:hypothetical protein